MLITSNYRIKFIPSPAPDPTIPEFFDENQIEYGQLKKIKFSYDKRNWYLEIVSKDQRYFKFRFDSQNMYDRCINAVERFSRISQTKNLFSCDYVKSLIDKMQTQKLEGNAQDWIIVNYGTIVDEVMADMKRMKISEGNSVMKGRF
mmetsp:Transcript_26377/g.25542  ORF Transcript_26377/g.25542 Transcript_26377/m.25542 type:complete len:146 (+) Transcript_26377:264-701(+)